MCTVTTLNSSVEIKERISTLCMRETEAHLEVVHHTVAKTKGGSICQTLTSILVYIFCIK